MKETIYTTEGNVECDVLSINGDASMLVKIGKGTYDAIYIFSDLAYGPHWELDRQSTTEELVELYSNPEFVLEDGLEYLNDWKNYVVDDVASSEQGQALLGYILLLLVLVIVGGGIVSLLTGNTTVLDMYNAIGTFFQSLG